jgi:hypothetical protein
MHRLFPQKLRTIIELEVLEDRLIEIVRRSGASRYTIQRATGAGCSGGVSGELDVDINIKFHVIVSQGRMSAMRDDVEEPLREGNHLTVFVSDKAVLGPEKLEKPMIEASAG